MPREKEFKEPLRTAVFFLWCVTWFPRLFLELYKNYDRYYKTGYFLIVYRSFANCFRSTKDFYFCVASMDSIVLYHHFSTLRTECERDSLVTSLIFSLYYIVLFSYFGYRHVVLVGFPLAVLFLFWWFGPELYPEILSGIFSIGAHNGVDEIRVYISCYYAPPLYSGVFYIIIIPFLLLIDLRKARELNLEQESEDGRS